MPVPGIPLISIGGIISTTDMSVAMTISCSSIYSVDELSSSEEDEEVSDIAGKVRAEEFIEESYTESEESDS